MHRRFAVLLPVMALAACAERQEPRDTDARDPAVVQALNDPLMTDPDLSQRNEAAAAITVVTDTGLPILPATPDAVAAALDDAARLAGGSDKLLPPPPAVGEVEELPHRWSPGHHLTAIGAAGPCLKRLKTGAIFAAQMPPAVPIYPRAGTLAAAGSDAAGCHARAVRFTTPVPPEDVLAFYWSRAKVARLSPEHLTSGPSQAVRGRGDRLTFDVRVRGLGDHTLVELATLSR